MNKVKKFGLSLLISAIVLGCSQHTQPIPESTATPSAQPKPAAPAVAVDAATAGSISGVVDFKGAVPKFPSVDMTADPGCPQKPQPSETVVVNKGKLANVFVYVKAGLPQGSFAAPSDPVVLDQKGCRY